MFKTPGKCIRRGGRKEKQNKHAENNCPPTYPNTLGRTQENGDKQERRHNFCMLIPPALRCGYRLKNNNNKKIKQKHRSVAAYFRGKSGTSSSPRPKRRWWWASPCCRGPPHRCPVPAAPPALTRCRARPSRPKGRF